MLSVEHKNLTTGFFNVTKKINKYFEHIQFSCAGSKLYETKRGKIVGHLDLDWTMPMWNSSKLFSYLTLCLSFKLINSLFF